MFNKKPQTSKDGVTGVYDHVAVNEEVKSNASNLPVEIITNV